MIDLRTLLVLVAVADLMVAFILLASAGRRITHGIIAWIAALGARALAVSILALGIQPPGATIAVSASLLALSMTLQATALLAYDSRRLPAWVHTAVIAGVALAFSLIGSTRTCSGASHSGKAPAKCSINTPVKRSMEIGRAHV